MKSLKSKVYFLTFAPLILLFLVVIINTQVLEKHRTVDDSYAFFKSVIDNYTNSVVKWQNRHANVVQNIVDIDKSKLISRDFLVSTSNAYKADVYYAQNDGKVYASDQSEEEFKSGFYEDPYDPRGESWFVKANSKVLMDDMYYEETVDDWVVSWVIRKEDGVFGMDVHIDDMDVADDNLVLPSSGKLLLIDSSDQIIIWDDNKLRGKKVSELDPVYSSEFLSQVVSDTSDHFTNFRSADGRENWILGANVADSKWRLFICLDRDIVLSSLNSTIRATYLTMIIVLAVTFAAVSFFVSKYISVPVYRVNRLIGKMNSDHDFTERVKSSSSDEIGEMTRNMNEFMDEQCRVVGSIKQVGDSIMHSIDSCSQIVSNVEAELRNQDEVTASFSKSIDEMNAATNDISSNSSEVASKVSSVHSLSSNSVDIANNAMQYVNALMQDLENSSAAIKHLNELTSSVVSVVGTIRDIADQTNLLALNASIEAARAGENGRGFAVVADEVRALSSRTKESIAEIEETTRSFKAGTDSVVGMISKSSESCRDTIDWVNSIVNKLNEINGYIGDVSKMTAYIADSTSVQQHNFALAEDCMHQMRNIARQISSDMGKCSEAYEKLLKDADNMTTVFSVFKLPEDKC